MDFIKKHNTEIYKDEQHGHHVITMLLIFIYFCAMCFGDVHVAHLYIFLCNVFWWCRPCCSSLYISVLCLLVMSIRWTTWTSSKNIAQKYIKMNNMDITNKHNTEIYKDEQHGRLLIFIYFCAMFIGDVHVVHLYIFLCYVFWWCPCCSSLYISVLCFLVMSILLIDEQHGHHQNT
jgi:hypothetical protein